ncbi:MAG: carbohydrate transporter rane protein 1, family [Geminicoccaceae bacterium]|nr:carbohydrate transporter rane protein 1, family [Geminicoccaceae bacterium]
MARTLGADVGGAEGAPAGIGERLRAGREETPWGVILVFLAPALVMYLALTAYPIVKTFYNSVHLIQPNQPDRFVGLSNYLELLTGDLIFEKALVNTFIWATVAPVVDVTLGLLLAACLYVRMPWSRFFRVAWFSPVLISYVVVGVIWMWIYNYDWGAANGLLRWLGLGDWAHIWLGDPRTALWAVILVDAWKWVGFHMVVCLAALHSLPREVIEAAELDNCGFWQKLVFVEIPLIRTTLVGLLILAFIGKMKVFDLVWIMTKGGPLWSTETLATYTYKRAFEWQAFDLGYPSAIAVVSFLLVIVIVLLASWLVRRRERLEF